MTGVEAVIFDWGGTLAEFVSTDEIDVWQESAVRLSSVAHAIELPRDTDATRHLRDQLYAAEERFWERVRGDRRSGRVHEIVADALHRLGLDHEHHGVDLHHVADGHLRAWDPHIRHFDDAVETLTELRRRGIRIGLLSNTHWPGHFHDELLERDGLLEHFDARTYSSDLHVLKPHAEAFEAALASVGVTDPTRAVFVGDRLYDDISGAKAVGIRAVLRPNPHVETHDVQPDGVAEHLVDLVAMVDAWS